MVASALRAFARPACKTGNVSEITDGASVSIVREFARWRILSGQGKEENTSANTLILHNVSLHPGGTVQCGGELDGVSAGSQTSRLTGNLNLS